MHGSTHRNRSRTAAVSSILLFVVFWAAAASAPTPGLAAPAAQTLKPVAVKVTVLEGPQVYPIHVMQIKGIADKYNLKVELVEVAGPQALYTQMQNPEFQIGFGNPFTIAIMRAQGLKLTNVSSMYRYTNDVVVPAESAIKSFADLKGKRIGIFGGPSAGTTWLLRLVTVKEYGFDAGKDAKVQYGAPPLLVGLLEKGELDAIMVLDPFTLNLVSTGKYRIIGNIGNIWREKSGQDPMVVAINVNETWAKANQDAVKRFVTAYREATEYLKTHTDVWPDLAKKLDIKTEAGIKLLRDRTVPNLLSKWDKKLIDDQYRYQAEIVKTFGDAEGVPKQIPDGTFDLSYAP